MCCRNIFGKKDGSKRVLRSLKSKRPIKVGAIFKQAFLYSSSGDGNDVKTTTQKDSKRVTKWWRQLYKNVQFLFFQMNKFLPKCQVKGPFSVFIQSGTSWVGGLATKSKWPLARVSINHDQVRKSDSKSNRVAQKYHDQVCQKTCHNKMTNSWQVISVFRKMITVSLDALCCCI